MKHLLTILRRRSVDRFLRLTKQSTDKPSCLESRKLQQMKDTKIDRIQKLFIIWFLKTFDLQKKFATKAGKVEKSYQYF